MIPIHPVIVETKNPLSNQTSKSKDSNMCGHQDIKYVCSRKSITPWSKVVVFFCTLERVVPKELPTQNAE